MAQPTVADELPFVDEHSLDIDQSPDEVWAALVGMAGGLTAGPVAETYARLVGCADRRASGPRPLDEGSTIPGFHVVSSDAPRRLALAGRHHFSRYLLTFRIEPRGEGACRLVAETRATFPGPHGALYRLVVVGSRGHRFLVRRMLSEVAARVGRRPAS